MFSGGWLIEFECVCVCVWWCDVGLVLTRFSSG